MTLQVPEGFLLASADDPAETRVGPFYKNKNTQRTGMFTEPGHCNDSGIVHGGILMTFADFTISALALWACPGESVVTVSLNCDFMASGEAGAWISGQGTVLRRTNSLVFAQGTVSSDDTTLLAFNGVIKHRPPR